MNVVPSPPDPQVALTLEELTACQHLAATHITFSLTLACPLKCAHCIVDAGPEKSGTTMPVAIATRYADQMQELADYGIKGVCFTGGEPFVARQQLSLMSKAADAAGMQVSVVTAAHWANKPDRAKALVARFSSIHCWDISYDAHHLPWVDITHIKNAVDAIRAAGRTVNVRVTYSDPITEDDLKVMNELRDIGETDCVAQSMRPVGRGKDLHAASPHGWSPWIKPCLTQGMVIRYDGSVAPCCLNMVESRAHPFDFGDPRSINLTKLHRNFASDPLLQLIRALGFSQIREWIEEEGLTHLLPDPMPEEVCELCTSVLQDPTLSALAMRRATAKDTPLRIAIIAAKVLGETAMLTDLGEMQLLDQMECAE
jgi:pyruvate-formate lyase-activating enzyme